jgi:hypothetical protein
MKSESASELLIAFGGISQELTSRGLKPKLQTMENEASSALKFTSQKITWLTKSPHPTLPQTQCNIMMLIWPRVKGAILVVNHEVINLMSPIGSLVIV